MKAFCKKLSFTNIFLSLRLNLHGGHQTGFGIQVHSGVN